MARKNILINILWLIPAALIVVLLGFTQKQQNNIALQEIKIDLEGHAAAFITENEIVKTINDRQHVSTGMSIKDINTDMCEKLIEANPYVAQAEVFSTIDGILNVKISPRNPLLRVVNNRGEHFYIDEAGFTMPVSLHYSAKVLVANGNISAYNNSTQAKRLNTNLQVADSTAMLDQLYSLAVDLKKSNFWNAQIEQIYVNEQNEIELIPRVGNHSILIGDISFLEEKLEKLFVFYKKGLNKTGWNKYKQINLKFKDQVVCKLN
ncbi:MAG: hypothetical protein HKO56_08730 [Bacteroidia bacterium]|nr:hypothetical protein [Bacteroidia bacterium]NNC85083.1 hypothetical protein [Bacteroidia bacterium]NNM16729.1 hypothetical protein [Bacteroidia bacterium]